MTAYIGLLLLTAPLVATSQTRDVSVSAYLDEIRKPAVRRNSLDALYQSARASFAERQYDDAENGFRRLYEQEPENPRALKGIADVYLARDRKQDAIALLQSAVTRQPARTDFLFALVDISVQAGDDDLAISALTDALNKFAAGSHERVNIYLQLAETYRHKGDVRSAASALREARELLPGDATIGTKLVQALDASGETIESAKVAREMLGVDPTDADALVNHASELSDGDGDLQVAAACAEIAKRLLPDSLRVDEVLGTIYLKSGKSQDAAGVFERLAGKVPEAWTYHRNLGMALFMAGDKPRALGELNEALKHDPPDSERERIGRLIWLSNGAK